MKRKREINYYGPNKFRFPRTSYCGPGWSDNKWQNSVCGYSTARSYLDQNCKEHDCSYYHGDEEAADWRFARNVSNPLIGFAPLVSHKINNIMAPHKKYNSPPYTPRTHQNNRSHPYTRTAPLSVQRGATRAVARAVQAVSNISYGVGSMRSIKGRKIKRNGTKKGVVYQHETGGTAQEVAVATNPISQVLYIGHTTHQRIRESVTIWAALFKALMQKAGFDVPNLTESFLSSTSANNDYSWTLTYQIDDQAALSTTSGTIGSIDSMATSVVTTLNALTNPRRILFKLFTLNDTNDVTQLKPNAFMNLERTLIHLKSTSQLSIQNVTPNEGDSGPLGQSFTDKSGTNPLKGKLFVMNYASFQLATGSKVPDSMFGLANLGKGASNQLIQLYNEAGTSSDMKTALKDIPMPNMIYKCSKEAPVYVVPGALAKSYIKYTTTMYLNTFYDGNNNTQTYGITNGEFGKCAIFALDKVIDTRNEKTAPAVTWQIDNTFLCHVSQKKMSPTIPFKNITNDVY